MAKWVYLFSEGNANMRELLGGKGANLAEMTSLGLPVPQGFTITTEACTPVSYTHLISSAESEENNTYLSYNWAVGTNLDREQYIAFSVLDYALLTTQGAPIKQALLDAGIGTDIYGGYDSGTYQPIFSVIAKHANAGDQEKFV